MALVGGLDAAHDCLEGTDEPVPVRLGDGGEEVGVDAAEVHRGRLA